MTGRPVGIVLTGGGSSRMGADKATMTIDGKPMMVRVADALWEAGCDPVECQGGDIVAIAEFGLEAVPDLEPDGGPVVGIAEALVRHAEADVVIAACDLVDLDGATVEALRDAGARQPDVDVVVARANGRRHLLSWWRAGSADRVRQLVAEGHHSYLDVLSELGAIDVEVPERTVANMNTPDDVSARG